MNNATNIEKTANNINKNYSRQFWCNYAWTIRNYVVSSLVNFPDTTVSKGWVINSIYKICDSSKFDDLSLKMASSLYALFIIISDKAELAKNGASTLTTEMMDIAVINSLSSLLYSLNKSWDYERWEEIIEIIFNLFLNMIAARTANDWILDVKYQEAILDQFNLIADRLAA